MGSRFSRNADEITEGGADTLKKSNKVENDTDTGFFARFFRSPQTKTDLKNNVESNTTLTSSQKQTLVKGISAGAITTGFGLMFFSSILYLFGTLGQEYLKMYLNYHKDPTQTNFMFFTIGAFCVIAGVLFYVTMYNK